MKELKNEIELIGGNLLDSSDGVFVRAYNKAEIKQIQELFKKYPKYSLGCFPNVQFIIGTTMKQF